MTDLLTRLETESGRELDAAIAELQGWEVFYEQDHVGQAVAYCVWGDVTKGEKGPLPRYTDSVDAALTLVPEDPANPGKPMLWSISYDEDGVSGPRSYTAALGKGYHDPEFIYGHSTASPQNAITIAALKARGIDAEGDPQKTEG